MHTKTGCSFKLKANLPRVGARRDHEIIFRDPLISAEDKIDAVVNPGRCHLGIVRDIDLPVILLVTNEVVADSTGGVAPDHLPASGAYQAQFDQTASDRLLFCGRPRSRK